MYKDIFAENDQTTNKNFSAEKGENDFISFCQCYVVAVVGVVADVIFGCRMWKRIM